MLVVTYITSRERLVFSDRKSYENIVKKYIIRGIDMKKLRIVLMGLAGLLLILMITLMIITNSQEKEAGGLSEYESANIDDLPEEKKRVDESLEIEAGLDVGKKAPDFELQSLDGETFKLSDYRGQVVMLNFWASWCPPCRVEMPHMDTYYQNHQEDDIEILAVNMTTLERGSREKVPEFVEKHALTFPILMDENGDIKDLYKVMVYPTTYMVNEDGIITDRINIPLDVDIISWLFEESKDFTFE